MSDAGSTPAAPLRFPVESGHIMVFARAIGDPNPIYYDRAYAARSEVGHVLAPPTFTAASAQFDPDYALRPKFGVPWIGSGRAPRGQVSGRGEGYLHAEQHYVFHRHVRSGEVLFRTVRVGESWEKTSRRGGRLSFHESISEFSGEGGELAVTSRSVRVRPSKTPESA